VLLDESILAHSRKGYFDGDFFFADGNEDYYLSGSNIMSMRLKLEWVVGIYKGRGKLLM
jgi:hypothetical protein